MLLTPLFADYPGTGRDTTGRPLSAGGDSQSLLLLARDPAAYHLPRMITGGREKFLTIPASVKCHINLWHSFNARARVRVNFGGSPLRAAPIQMSALAPKTLTLFDLASRSWFKLWRSCNTVHVGDPTRASLIVGATTSYLGKHPGFTSDPRREG